MTVSKRAFYSIIFFICCAALVAAQLVEAEACTLCHVQQAVYGGIGLVSLIGSIKPNRLVVFGLIVGFLSLLGVSAYHMSIQLGWIVDPCHHTTVDSMTTFLATLEKPGCSVVTWRLLGLPVSALNMLFSTFFLAFFFIKFLRVKKQCSINT